MKDPSTPWNKGLAVGQKKPFTRDQMTSIARSLHRAGKERDLALFTLGIQSMLRSIDLLNLKVQQVVDSRGLVKERFAVIQHKTRRPVVVQMDGFTARAISNWIDYSNKSSDDYLFTGLTLQTKNQRLSRSHVRTMVKKWASAISLDTKEYSTHSLRRSRAALVYDFYKDPEIARILLGQSSLATTAAYLGVSVDHALEAAADVPIFNNLNP